jgi:hypothetical protein
MTAHAKKNTRLVYRVLAYAADLTGSLDNQASANHNAVSVVIS